MQTKNPTDPKSIQTLMGESKLAAIVKKAQVLDKIERSLPDLLGTEICGYLQVLNLKENHLKENCLILSSSTSAIATNLRYQQDDLLKQINRIEGLPEIHCIECVVRPL